MAWSRMSHPAATTGCFNKQPVAVLHALWFAALSVVWVVGLGTQAATLATEGELVFQAEAFRYVIGRDGANRHFIDRRTGADHYPGAATSSFATINKQGRQYPGAVTHYREGKLTLQFGDSGSAAVIGVDSRRGYLAFEVLELSNPADITDLSLLNLKLDLKGEPGEPFAACAVELNIQTFNSTIPGYNNRLHVYCNPKDGFLGAKVAVIGCPGPDLQSKSSAITPSFHKPTSAAHGRWTPQSRGGLISLRWAA